MSPRAFEPDPVALLADDARLRGLLRSLTRDADAAEDLAQETWLRAARRAPEPRGGLGPWLRRTAERLAWRGRRGAEARARRDAAAARPEATPAAGDVVERLELRRRVVDAVLGLPEPGRTAVLLRHFEGLKPAAVAAATGVPVATVRTRLRRALAELRRRLDATYGARAPWIVLAAPAASPFPFVAGLGALAMSAPAKIAAAVAVVCVGVVVWKARPEAPSAKPKDARATDAASAAADPARRAPSEDRAKQGGADSAPIASRPFAERPPAGDEVATYALRVVDARDGSPVADAEVVVGAPPFARLVARTDGEGRARIGGARPAAFEPLVVLHPGFVRIERTLRDFPATRRDGVDDLGDVLLERGARVAGRVVDARGRGIAGARVYVAAGGLAQYLPMFADASFAATTDASGAFVIDRRLGGVSARTPLLFALAPEGMGFAPVPLPQGREDVRDVVVSVAVGAGGRVRVRRADDAPVAGARIVVAPHFAPYGPCDVVAGGVAPPPAPLDPELARRFVATTDENGVATFSALPADADGRTLTSDPNTPGRYDLWIIAEGATPAFVALRVAADDPFEESVVVRKRERLAVRAQVADEAGRPIAGARVSVGPDAAATTDARGVCLVEGAPAEASRLFVRADAPGRKSATVSVEVPGRADVVDAAITLKVARTISGRVVDDEGAGVAGAYVSAVRPDGSETAEARATDATGAFRLEDVSDGPWTLRCFPPGAAGGRAYETPRFRRVRGGDRDVVVRLASAETGRARVVVEVVDARTGAAADSVHGSFTRVERRFANDVGRGPLVLAEPGRLVAHAVVPGEWRVGVALADGRRAARRVVVGPADTEVLARLEVAAPAAVAGRVVLEAPEAGRRPTLLVRAVVRGEGAEAEPLEPFLARRRDGFAFRFEGLAPGARLRLVVDEDGLYDFVDVVATVDGGTPAEIRPRAAASLAFTGTCPEPSGVVLLAAEADGPFTERASVVVEAPGDSFVLGASLRPGPVRWRVERYPLDVPPAARRVVASAEGSLAASAGLAPPVPVAFPP